MNKVSSYYDPNKRSPLIYAGPPPRRHGWLRVPAVILIIVSLLLVVLAVATFSIASDITHPDIVPAARVSANVMPDYQNVRFRTLDDSFSLSGWYFYADGDFKGNVIVAHGSSSNRLPFGAETILLYDALTASGYNVLAFDLRHSGSSEGAVATCGYAEAQDVAAAMMYSNQISGSDNFLLMGIGSGCTAVLGALDILPRPDTDREALRRSNNVVDNKLSEMDFDLTNVSGLILNGALEQGDDYIRQAVRQRELPFSSVFEQTVPTAVRMSAGLVENADIIQDLLDFTGPVLLMTGDRDEMLENDDYAAGTIRTIDERERLLPTRTTVYYSSAKQFLDDYSVDPLAYIDAVSDWLQLQ